MCRDCGDREVAPHVSEYVKGNLGKNRLTAAGAGRCAALDQPAEAQADRARLRLGQADRAAAPGEAARAQAGGLVLPAGDGLLQPGADAETDSDSSAGLLGPKCLWKPVNKPLTEMKPQQKLTPLSQEKRSEENRPNTLPFFRRLLRQIGAGNATRCLFTFRHLQLYLWKAAMQL